jgi:3-phosphoshikimate 1-carboxyvinyltransferase
MLASLAEGGSMVINPLMSRDTRATMNGCRAFGASLDKDESGLKVVGSKVGLPSDVVNVENSGSTLRFLTSVLASAPAGYSVLTGDESIRRRPMQPLLDALAQLGAEAWSSRGNGCAPVIVRGGGIRGGEVTIRGDVSSQFISSLLMSGPLASRDVTVKLVDAVSRPYIDATIAVMSRFGIEVERDGYRWLRVRPGQGYEPCEFEVPADMSSASFVGAAVALMGGRVVLRRLDPSLPQGDARVMEVLRAMGAAVKEVGDEITIESEGEKLDGGSFDLSDTPDLLPVVAVLALRARSEVVVSGVRHARFKETDRVAMLSLELSKLGVELEEREDGLTIRPSPLRPAVLDAHDDHRLFMAFSLASLLFPSGIPVAGADSMDVSYPSFLQDMNSLGASVRRLES